MVTAYECESCHTVVYFEGKEKPFCPVCRGRMFETKEKKPKEAKKIRCPRCEREFYMTREPFKCPFCDYSFSLGTYW
jgi:Zn finger protein HypA/HybF involved in hydrogenase expression